MDQRLEVTFSSLGDAVMATDTEGRVTFMNPMAEALTGWPQAHASAQPLAAVLHLVHEETRQAVEDPVATVVRAGTAVRFAHPTVLLARDGTVHVIENSGAPRWDAHGHLLGVVFVFREITEQRRTEAALARAAALLDLTHEAILVLGLDETILFWNRGAAALYGWPAEEALGQVAYQLLRTRFPEPFEAIKTELLRRGRWEGDLDQTTRDGTAIVVASRWALQRDAQGRPLAFLELNSDITARKHAEEALRQLNATLEHRVQVRTHELAEANAELEAFASSVAHDLRTPLRSIHGFAEALVDEYGAQLDATGQDFLRRIIRASTRMETLIQDLLAFSRVSRDALPLESVSLQVAVHAAQAQLASDLQATGASLRLEAPLPAVIAHPPTLVQVLVNILANAIKFTDPGVPPAVTAHAECAADRVRLWIEDNGIGIPAEHQERIFQPFERLHGPDTYAGTGMGLAIVRRGVERMGGQVGVVSAPGQGSRFWIALPPADGRITTNE
jgi:PAS domain S-box-containing protein